MEKSTAIIIALVILLIICVFCTPLVYKKTVLIRERPMLIIAEQPTMPASSSTPVTTTAPAAGSTANSAIATPSESYINFNPRTM